MSEFYNNKEEEKFSNLLSDLKKLPKIEAPENFEFNLMTRIQNRNFTPVEEERQKFNIFKFLAPSVAVLATAVLFFIFYPQQKEIQTQLAEKHNITDTQNIAGNTADKKIESLFNQPKEKKISKLSNQTLLKTQKIAQNSQPINQPSIYNQKKSVSVDDFISGANSNQNTSLRNSVVNSGENPIVDGFFVEKKTDKKVIEKYRTESDSLRKAKLMADSLKNARK